jgi:hypothetical protein
LHELADALRAAVASAGVPLNTSPSDAVGWDQVGPGVYIVPEIEKLIGSVQDPSRPLPLGARLDHYLPDAYVISPEVGLWRVRELPEPADGYPSAIARTATSLRQATGFLGNCLDAIDSAHPRPTVFRTAILEILASNQESLARLEQPDAQTGAREHDAAIYMLNMRRLRVAGMLLQILEAETAAGNAHAAIRTTTSHLEQHFTDWCRACKAALQPRPLPLAQSIQVQLHSTLLTAAHAANQPT